MKTTDWKYEFTSLPHWENHSLPYVFDEYLEIPQTDILCCVYSIAEVTMCNYLGFLAILKNKQNPELILNITDNILFLNQISVNAKGNLIFLQSDLYDKSSKRSERPLIIIDVEKNMFSYYKTNNYNPCYTVVELNEDTFGIKADDYQIKHDKRLKVLSRKKIKIRHLQWYAFTEFSTLPQKIFRKKCETFKAC